MGTQQETEHSYAPRPIVVSSAEDFITHLQDGDVLLFDKLSPLNRLVQWGDNRPAGHVGVWHAGGVYEATVRAVPGGGSQGGVFLTPFEDLMALKVSDDRGDVALIRTVSALRHKSLSEEARGAIQLYLAQCTDAGFGVLDMVLLTPFALERSNAAGVGSGTELPQRVTQALAYYAKKRARSGERREKVFCSQLVYRAFKQADVPIEIRDPLYSRYHSRPHYSAFRDIESGSTGGAAGAAMTTPFDDYRRVFEEEIMREMTGIPLEVDDSVGEPDARPRARSPLMPEVRQEGRSTISARSPRAPELGDMVTPGDFWSSPSFEPIAVLHRPVGV